MKIPKLTVLEHLAYYCRSYGGINRERLQSVRRKALIKISQGAILAPWPPKARLLK